MAFRFTMNDAPVEARRLYRALRRAGVDRHRANLVSAGYWMTADDAREMCLGAVLRERQRSGTITTDEEG